jgi:hypothetical protein
MKITLQEKDSRKNDPDFRETAGSFSVIKHTLEKGLRELNVWTDDPEAADWIGEADSLATDFWIPNKRRFQINFQDCINTIPQVALDRKRANLGLKLFSLNQHTADLWAKYGHECGVIGAGIDGSFWRRYRTELTIVNNPFRFVFSSFSNFRSGLDLLLQAWEIAFSGYRGPYLIIKNTSDSQKLQQVISEYNKRCGNISYINERKTFSWLRELYSDVEVGVNVYRMSGHGLIIGESAACGCLPLVGDFDPSNQIAKPSFAQFLKPSREVYVDEIMPEMVNDWGLTNTFNGLTFPERPRVYDYDVEEYAHKLQLIYQNYYNWDYRCREKVLDLWDYKKSAANLVTQLERAR